MLKKSLALNLLNSKHLDSLVTDASIHAAGVFFSDHFEFHLHALKKTCLYDFALFTHRYDTGDDVLLADGALEGLEVVTRLQFYCSFFEETFVLAL